MTTAARADMNLLGSDTWRLYIDLERQHEGSATFDEGISGVREPGFLASVLDAHGVLAGGAGQDVGLEDYIDLQRRVTAHDPSESLWRPGRCWVHMLRAGIEPGLGELWARLGVSLEETAPAGIGRVRILMRLHEGDEEAIAADVEARLCAGQAAIRRAPPDGRIAAIAALHQELELLHATRDANTRRHLVLLQRLLANAGLPPSLLTEPNDVYVRTPASWAHCVAEGIARTRTVHHARQRGMDVPTALTAFDVRHRPRGSGLGRWHRPESPWARWL